MITNPFKFGKEGISFDYGTKMSPSLVTSVLDVAERVAKERGTLPLIVAFDEFQELTRFSPDLALEGLFRSAIRSHQNVNYVFFGSRTHAYEPTAEFVGEYRERHSLGASASIHNALRVLVENGIVEHDVAGYRIGDPFLARYLRQSPAQT